MTERARFVSLHETGLYSMTELCERFQISRKTGYKWLARFHAAGVAGLGDQRRTPHQCPRRTAPALETALVAARQQRPHWGPKKLLAHLRATQPELAWPAVSTASAVLRRHGLISPRAPRRPRPPHPGAGPL